jgi:hypothetical protein
MALVLVNEHLGVARPVGTIDPPSSRVSIRELIRARVELEVERESERRALATAEEKDRRIRGEAEALLNAGPSGGWIIGRPNTDGRGLEALIDDAERAFVAGRFYILLDDCQAMSLDQNIDLRSTAQATFLLLTALQGG